MGLNNVFYWDILKLKAQKLHADQVVYIYMNVTLGVYRIYNKQSDLGVSKDVVYSQVVAIITEFLLSHWMEWGTILVLRSIFAWTNTAYFPEIPRNTKNPAISFDWKASTEIFLGSRPSFALPWGNGMTVYRILGISPAPYQTSVSWWVTVPVSCCWIHHGSLRNRGAEKPWASRGQGALVIAVLQQKAGTISLCHLCHFL